MTASLLSALRARANHRGLVLASEQMLARETATGPTSLRRSLHQLAAAGEIRVLAPLPFLVCKFISWSDTSRAIVPAARRNSAPRRSPQRVVPVSGAAAAKQQHEDRGAGEGGTLLDRVLEVLGPDADPAEFLSILAGRDPALVLRCLRRVEATKTIRVSRAALFRSLLSRLDH